MIYTAYLHDALPIYGATPLVIASENGHDKVVSLLLEAGADKDKWSTTYGATPLFIASFKGHDKVVSLLLEARAEKD